MSKRDNFARVVALACVVAFGCASGGVARLGDDADVPDTNTGGKHDAPPFDGTPPVDGAADAMILPDAMQMPDAGGGGGFCQDNTQCIPGECCFFFVCKPGQGVGNNVCFPT